MCFWCPEPIAEKHWDQRKWLPSTKPEWFSSDKEVIRILSYIVIKCCDKEIVESKDSETVCNVCRVNYTGYHWKHGQVTSYF